MTNLREKRREGKLSVIAARFGWRGYRFEVYSPFIGGQSYHFELHAPDGMQVAAAGLSDGRVAKQDAQRVHLYVDDARLRLSSVAWAQLRIRGHGFVGAAALTAVAILMSLLVAVWQAPQLADTNTSAPALLLLFPGLVATYLARPAHPLVTRLLNLARRALVACTVAAYVAAGRLALVSSVHPANEKSLRCFFIACAVVAFICSAALIVSWRLPAAKAQAPPTVRT